MKYEVFQIVLSDSMRDAIEICLRAGQPDRAAEIYPEYKAYLSAALGKYEEYYFRYYSHVADIEAETLDGVFRIGNIGPEYAIDRFKPMHSISVGDIIFDGERFHFVDRIGFRDITRVKDAA
jgi:hypothetical protein